MSLNNPQTNFSWPEICVICDKSSVLIQARALRPIIISPNVKGTPIKASSDNFKIYTLCPCFYNNIEFMQNFSRHDRKCHIFKNKYTLTWPSATVIELMMSCFFHGEWKIFMCYFSSDLLRIRSFTLSIKVNIEMFRANSFSLQWIKPNFPWPD